MRALLYLRQSVSDDDESLSLDSQASALRAWADTQGWVVVGEVRDWNEKGWDDTRPGLIETMRRASDGDVAIVAVWSIDRLARSVRIQENTLHDLNKIGVEVRSYKEPWVAQPLFRQILGAIAEEQTRTIAAHVRRALSERAHQGKHHGRVPFGYRRDPDTKRLVPDPERAALVRDLFDGYVAGDSISDLVRLLLRAGVPTMTGAPWARTTVQAILTNPTYTGAVRFGEVTVPAAHPPLIELSLWERAQARKTSYTWQRAKDTSSWLEGKIEHACGHRMYLSTCGRRSPQPHFLCRGRLGQILTTGPTRTHTACTIHPGRVRQSYAERQAWMSMEWAMTAILPIDEVMHRAERSYATSAPDVAAERAKVTDTRQRALDRRARAEELYLSGSRDRAWLDAIEAQVLVVVAEADAALSALPAPVDHAAIADRHAALHALGELTDLALPADRKALLAELGHILIGPGRNLHPSVQLIPNPRYAHFFRQDHS